MVFQRAVQAYLWALPTNRHHFFEPNEIKRYSTGTKNTALKYDSDGSLTLYVQADPPAAEMRGNWLPTPKAAEFLLYLRGYWPQVAINDGSWMPPPVVKAK
ncbi:MAG: hypothetical protein JWL84_5029 [Rhodospirillales bacterium]|nr:hypothetical protein [Rhodospirillales bacterium]